MNYKKQYYKFYGLDECDFLPCAICGKEAVNLHHIIYKSQGGTDHPTNLIPLCYVCHNQHHTQNIPDKETLKNLKDENL